MASASAYPLELCRATGSRTLGGETAQLHEATLAFEPATLNLLFGPRHCGKNVLLRLLGLLETPLSGEVCVLGRSTAGWSEADRTEVRSRHFGFVFESPFLLPSFNVVENVAMPYFKLTGEAPDKAREQTDRALSFVGMQECAEAAVESLSLEAQWRVSLARALVTSPLALFVENIDHTLRDDALIHFLELLSAVRRVYNCCVVVSATARDLSAFCTRAVELEAGHIIHDWQPGGLLS